MLNIHLLQIFLISLTLLAVLPKILALDKILIHDPFNKEIWWFSGGIFKRFGWSLNWGGDFLEEEERNLQFWQSLTDPHY